MNCGTKAAIFIPQSNCFQLRAAALFHSTPVLERKRRNIWGSRSNGHSRRSGKLHGKQSLLRNFNAYADYVFQSWRDDFDEHSTSSSRGPSWFEKQSNGPRRNFTGNQGSRRPGRSFQFCDEEIDVESIFRSAFGGNRCFYWSFINEENPQWRKSSNYSNFYEKSWEHQFEYDYDSSPESDNLGSDLASYRLALGLNASGPLKMEEVKNAYRACALKWHPDRHQGSSKVIAEEKFKHCSAAYQSLCDKLAPAQRLS